MNITIKADAVAIVSAIIALIAMFVSIWQAVIARHSFKLQKQLYDEGKPKFRIKDILDSYVVVDNDSEYLKLMFYPLVTNLSDKPMIIEKIRLHLVGENEEVVLVPCIMSDSIHDGYTINGNSSVSEWVCFEISKEEYKKLKLIKHTLCLHDAYQNSDSMSVIWVKEMVTDNERLD